MSKRKEIVSSFLLSAAKGDLTSSVRDYFSEKFFHHNPYFKHDAESLFSAMVDSAVKNPNKQIHFKHILEEENIVMSYSHIKQNETDRGAAVCHIFRFENNKIVEMWDVVQLIPENMLNEMGMF